MQFHMSKVAECVRKMEEVFIALAKDDYDTVKTLSGEISSLEHAADIAKADIRDLLSKSIYLPVDKGKLLEILSIQDNVADKCEDIGVLLTMKHIKMLDQFKDDFDLFLKKNVETFKVAESLMREFDKLLATSFSGPEAAKAKGMIDNIAFKEHEADMLQRKLLTRLFTLEEELSYGSFTIWLKIFQSLGNLANSSENLGDMVRTMLNLKA